MISANDRIEIAADKEILLASGGAYIRIGNGNILIHAPGKVEHKAAAHPFMGPTSLDVQYDLPKGDLKNKGIFILSSHPQGKGVLYTDEPYKLYKNGTLLQEGLTDEKACIVYECEQGANYKVELVNGHTFDITPKAVEGKENTILQASGMWGFRTYDDQSEQADKKAKDDYRMELYKNMKGYKL